MKMIDHYEDLLKKPKDEEHRIFLLQQLWFYQQQYRASQN
jgi:hypothetical protein